MMVVIMRVLSMVVVMKNILDNGRCDEIIMMMVMMTIMKIVVMIYFSCSQCCLPQFPGLLNFPYDTILSAGAFLVTDSFFSPPW